MRVGTDAAAALFFCMGAAATDEQAVNTIPPAKSHNHNLLSVILISHNPYVGSLSKLEVIVHTRIY
jgi:hypothetical protein